MEQRLARLKAALKTHGYEASLMEEHLIFLLRQLILVNTSATRQAGRVDAVRLHTRTEIYKRLLVRQFKAVFHRTPHQYLTQVRLAHAASLLKNSLLSVQEITYSCGFENTSAFCRAFRMEYGVSPLHFRTAGDRLQHL